MDNVCTCKSINAVNENLFTEGGCYKHITILRDCLNRPDLVKEALNDKEPEINNSPVYHRDLDNYFEKALRDIIKENISLTCETTEAFVSYALKRLEDEVDYDWELIRCLPIAFIKTASRNPSNQDIQKMAKRIEDVISKYYTFI